MPINQLTIGRGAGNGRLYYTAHLRAFLPVPVDELKAEFAEGTTPEDVCARSIRELAQAGARHFYVSNLPIGHAPLTLQRIIDRI